MGWNSISGFTKVKDPAEVQETVGITQFSKTDQASWYQIIGGIIIQGGNASAAGAISFNAPYEKQVMGVFVNGGVASAITNIGFTTSVPGYWFAIGI